MSIRPCPHCGNSLARGRLGPIELDLCSGCGGVWFDAGKLTQVAGAGPAVVRRLCAGVPAARPASAARPTGSAACPACRKPLESREYATMPGVSLDACRFCQGFWASRTALERLAAGLEAASPGARPASPPAPPAPVPPVAPAPAPAAAAPRPDGTRSISPGAQARPVSAAVPRQEPCPNCQAANSPQAAVCWACSRPLRGRPVGTCPGCGGTLRHFESEGVPLGGCEGCGGAWVTHDHLNVLMLQEAGLLRRLVERVGRGRSGASPSGSNAGRCPGCRTALLPTTLGLISPQPLPFCVSCTGLFLGPAEVEDVLLGQQCRSARPAFVRVR